MKMMLFWVDSLTRIAVALACWNFLLFLRLKTIKNSRGKCDSYTRMLQINPSFICFYFHFKGLSNGHVTN